MGSVLADNIVNEKRATLDPDQVDGLVLLTENIKIKSGRLVSLSVLLCLLLSVI